MWKQLPQSFFHSFFIVSSSLNSPSAFTFLLFLKEEHTAQNVTWSLNIFLDFVGIKGKAGLVGDIGFPGIKGDDGKVGISGDVGIPGSPGTMPHENFILKNTITFKPWPILSFCLGFTCRISWDCRHERKPRASWFSGPPRDTWAPGTSWSNRNQRYVYLEEGSGENGSSLKNGQQLLYTRKH